METYTVINSEITATTMSDAITVVKSMANGGRNGYVCFVNAHVSVMSRHDKNLRIAINKATFAFPDGMPVYLVGRYLVNKKAEKISAPDFLDRMFDDVDGRKLRHYFYGGKPEVLGQLVHTLKTKYPDSQIVGAESPPFRPLTEDEQQQAINRILESKAQLVWVGLGAPKQELWMGKNSKKLNSAILLGVGAAFDFHAGAITRAPYFMQKFGLEWLHRMMQEPGRLWKRYLITNSLFLLYTCIDWMKRVWHKNN